jgi:hypothetical protein
MTTCQVLFLSALKEFRIETLGLFHAYFRGTVDDANEVILHTFQDSLLTTIIQEKVTSV